MNQQKMLEVLKSCILFKGLELKKIEKILDQIKYQLKEIPKEGVVALEGDNCTVLGIVISGCLEVKKVYASGKVVTLTQLNVGNIFGEAIVFSPGHLYPASILAAQKSIVLLLQGEDIVKLCKEETTFLTNFMELLSTKILMLNNKVRELSLENIRQKIADYLLVEYGKQKKLKLTMQMSRKNMAEYMGVQRPSLSRELIKMREEGLIEFEKDIIEIKDLAGLSYCLE